MIKQRPPHQPVLADNEQTPGPVDLGQPHLLVEGAVAPHHHGNAVREPPVWHLGGRAQHRRREVMDLETGLAHRRGNAFITQATVEVSREGAPLDWTSF